MPSPISTWTTEERATEEIRRSKKYLPGQLAYQVDALLSPLNVAIMGGTLTLWAGSHLVGVGEVVDVALLLVGAATIGWSIGQVVTDLFTFATSAVDGNSEEDLERGAHAFASAVITAGVTAVMAILLRRSAKEIQIKRGPSLMDAARPKDPGLVNIGPDPRPTVARANPSIVGDPALPAGEGVTGWYGDVTYSTSGTATEQQLVRIHELVHRFLTPKLGLLRGFRAQVRASGYVRIVLLKYLEEALAETVAQVRVNGLEGVLTGLRFPIRNGYLKLNKVPHSLGTEGASLGTIIVGTARFLVVFVPAAPAPAVHHPRVRHNRPVQRKR